MFIFGRVHYQSGGVGVEGVFGLGTHIHHIAWSYHVCNLKGVSSFHVRI